ncbi:alpha/beta hydrolase [Chitinophaga qingshengii]|uniref:Esterase family protein n=1 Tax=Chitinophaga qingshengii TaxID=1569794 RepID=A0ABR7TU61_9BACT|nr:alpha/beta hydrolase-fold protein [Chitinophaga qingshengii]MBC9933147.1 esterase family protein [Chitinophaga qingshengii]
MKHSMLLLWLLLPLMGMAATVDTLAVFSNAMGKSVRTLVISPEAKKAGQRFPAVYVLHGYSGNPDRTLKEDIPSLPALADQYGILFILPDGAFDSWYINSPVKKNSQYETFIGQELVSYVDQHYPTLATRDQRALMGWSMGGHGALYVGVKHATNFGALGSICGAVNFIPFARDFGIDKLVGPDSTQWKYYNVLDNAPYFIFSQQQLVISCGAGDPFLAYNRRLHEYLEQQHVPHTYIEEPGVHDHDYWSKAAQYQVLFMHQYFTRGKY